MRLLSGRASTAVSNSRQLGLLTLVMSSQGAVPPVRGPFRVIYELVFAFALIQTDNTHPTATRSPVPGHRSRLRGPLPVQIRESIAAGRPGPGRWNAGASVIVLIVTVFVLTWGGVVAVQGVRGPPWW